MVASLCRREKRKIHSGETGNEEGVVKQVQRIERLGRDGLTCSPLRLGGKKQVKRDSLRALWRPR